MDVVRTTVCTGSTTGRESVTEGDIVHYKQQVW